jgi:large subunit ribosomal protein L18
LETELETAFMLDTTSKNTRRGFRQERARKRLRGTAAHPRLNVYRSLNHIYAQLVDDDGNRVVGAASTLAKALGVSKSGNVAAAKEVGKAIARVAKEKGIERVVFDRAGYQYHGRVRALAEAAREAGLQF